MTKAEETKIRKLLKSLEEINAFVWDKDGDRVRSGETVSVVMEIGSIRDYLEKVLQLPDDEMTKIINLNECKGKKVKSIEILYDFLLKIIFTDDTFIEFRSAYDGENCGMFLDSEAEKIETVSDNAKFEIEDD